MIHFCRRNGSKLSPPGSLSHFQHSVCVRVCVFVYERWVHGESVWASLFVCVFWILAIPAWVFFHFIKKKALIPIKDAPNKRLYRVHLRPLQRGPVSMLQEGA